MNLDKIKDWLIENKKYVLLALVAVAVFFFFKKSDDAPVDNSQVLENKTEQVKSNDDAASAASSSETQVEPKSSTVTVDISGAVRHQGVYTLKNGARIDELIKAAGGLKANAQLRNINRAVMLKDQDKVHVPYKGEKDDEVASAGMQSSSTTSSAGTEASSSSADNNEKINLNTASAADLQKLDGIGEKKAEQIIAYREQKGQFKKIEDLMQVSGIGEKTFAALKDKLAL